MEFKREIIVNKPATAVWEVLGNQYGEAYKWASGLFHSEGMGEPTIQGASCSKRSCDTTQGRIKEEVRKFDARNHTLEYEVIEGFPSFVDTAVNNWHLINQGNKTLVKMHLVVKTKGIVGRIMNPMMKMQMNKITAYILDDFKHYVETGQPSARKAKEMQKARKKAA